MRRAHLLFVLTLAGCGAPASGGLGRGIQRTQLVATEESRHAELVKAGDAAFAQRADRAQLEAAIARWTEAIALKDDDWRTYEKLARACYTLADAYLVFEKDASDDARARFRKVLEDGYTYAQRGIAAENPAIEQRLATGVDLKDAVALADRDGAGLLYWYATNLGKWATDQSLDVMVTVQDRSFAVMSKVLELDAAYFYGAADRYFGAYFAIAPSFAGGDLDQAWSHFQASLKHAPDYLATYNMIAEFYAPKKRDAALFDAMIQKVRDTPVDAIPELAFEAALEKKKAELLVQRKASGDLRF